MEGTYQLQAVDFTGPSRWRWRLCGPDGALIDEHAVDLDASSWQFEAMGDLYRYLRVHCSPDRRLADEARIIHLLGRWIGEHVFGSIGPLLISAAPMVVQVIIPSKAQVIAAYPLESAVVDGAALTLQHVVMAFKVGDPFPRAVQVPGARLRILGLFSVPDGQTALNLRKERHDLARLVEGLGDRAVELTFLQYGATRERLRAAAAQPDGWDIVHISGHGAAGTLVLETARGGPDPIGTGELAEILAPLAGRVQLVTLSACSSAALTAADQLALLGLEPTPDSDPPGPVGGPATSVLAINLANRLNCCVLAMRYPVTEEFAAALTMSVYRALILTGRSLGDTLAQELPPLVGGLPTLGHPALSLATAALFAATDARRVLFTRHGQLAAPTARPAEESAARRFPAQRDRFVGRVGPMARAGRCLAPDSDVPGVVLHGMAGAGKTACAVELAHTHKEAFDSQVWFTVPREPVDVRTLADFTAAIESALPEAKLLHLLRETAALRHALPRLAEAAAHSRVLLVVDNADSLLASDGGWHDERWGLLLHALSTHQGMSRLIVTSRRPVPLPGLRTEALHALSRDEAVLLARELPHLRELMDADATGEDEPDGTSRRAVIQILRAAQGHPKLLELADGQAADQDGLNRLLELADNLWRTRGVPTDGLFTDGRATAGEQDYAQVLSTWATAVTDRLTPAELTYLRLLCALEEHDRTFGLLQMITAIIWDAIWRQAGTPGQLPQPEALLEALAEQALVAVEPTLNGEALSVRIHPVIIAVVRASSPQSFQDAVDTEMATVWTTMLGINTGANRGDAEASAKAALDAQAALPYLLRLGKHDRALALISETLIRDTSPTTVAALLPAAHRLAEVTTGQWRLHAHRVLARLIQYTDPRAGIAEGRAVLAAAEAARRYDIAHAAASDAIGICLINGLLNDAQDLAEKLPRYAQLAGYGPWTQLADEHKRLVILVGQGHSERALAEVEHLLSKAEALLAASGVSDIRNPWQVFELLCDAGREAALRLERWEEALAYLDRIEHSQRRRGAPEHLTARTRFNTHGPLLSLGRTGEALAALQYSREIFEEHDDLPRLGKVLSALGAVESDRGHTDVAIDLERDALRVKYSASAGPADIAASHHNYGNYIAAAKPESALAHHLAAGLLWALTGSGLVNVSAKQVAEDLAAQPAVATALTTPGAVARSVGRLDGVHLDELLRSLATDPEVQQHALDSLFAQAEHEQQTSQHGGADRL